jgi:hypothetical protein
MSPNPHPGLCGKSRSTWSYSYPSPPGTESPKNCFASKEDKKFKEAFVSCFLCWKSFSNKEPCSWLSGGEVPVPTGPRTLCWYAIPALLSIQVEWTGMDYRRAEITAVDRAVPTRLSAPRQPCTGLLCNTETHPKPGRPPGRKCPPACRAGRQGPCWSTAGVLARL